MQFIDKSDLIYTNVYTKDDPNNIKSAVLSSDINRMPFIEIKRFSNNKEVPLITKDFHDKDCNEYKLSDDSASEVLTIMRTVLGLSRVEREAIDVALEAIAYRQEKNIE